ncbi:MAG: hypothetical protein Q4C50_03430 [Eubacteriales bacterium]|nr:hypothetical protein [Eubacteriales bacterium]
MKKSKRILAAAGAILLIGLYLATLVFALIDSPWAHSMFKLCVGFTIVLPVLLYAYTLIYRVLRKDEEEKND